MDGYGVSNGFKITPYARTLTHDASRARLCREVLRLEATREDGLEASVCQALLRAVYGVYCRTADCHAETLWLCQKSFVKGTKGASTYGWESGGVVLEIGSVEVLLGVVDGHATLDVTIILTFVSYTHQQHSQPHRHDDRFAYPAEHLDR